VSWSKHLDKIAVCGEQNSITILKIAYEKRELQIVNVLNNAHGIHDVNHVSWCPQSKHANFLASCGDDGLVKIWNL
jgi:WD40 repeat protein